MDDAVTAAAEALRTYEAIDFGLSAGFTERDTRLAAEAAVAVARPIIEAELRVTLLAELSRGLDFYSADGVAEYGDDDDSFPWVRAARAYRIVLGEL
jgi:hypothetical protein